jgi:hypothetical protein
MNLVDRDFEILRLVFKFRFSLGRQIKVLCGFSGARATDRRLKALIDGGYLERKKYLYGMPYLYTLTHKGRMILGVNKRADIIRVERIAHDINVIDTVIYYVKKYGVSLKDIVSDKELHIMDGFGTRKHHPDFVFTHNNKQHAVEIELSTKSKERIEQNIRDNYLRFERQIWIIGISKVHNIVKGFAGEYSNIEIIRLEEVLKYVRE